MFTIPCPDEVFISTELSSGLGRRLPCYNTEQCVIIVKEENTSAAVKEIADEHEENSSTEASKHGSQHSAHPGYHHHSKGRQKLTLEELKKKSRPGYKEFEAALGSKLKDLDEKTALQLWEDIFKR